MRISNLTFNIFSVMKIKIAAQTDIGKEREQNEDAFIICPDLSHPDWGKAEAQIDLGEYGALLVVADGMGGANAGEVASGLAVETLKKCFSVPEIADAVVAEERALAFLQESIKTADKVIKGQIQERPETMGMGTTVVVCWILKDKLLIAWCGDSRCYVFNPKKGLRALTKDHSYVQELVDKGELTEEAAFEHPDSNMITRGLGDFETEALADTVAYSIQPHDIFLLCSDGLCGYCRKSAIERVLNDHYKDINECCNKLMGLALDAGGYDNICIALALVCDEGETETNSASGLQNFFKRLFSRK